MNRIYSYIISGTVLMSLAACSEKDMPGNPVSKEGREVDFGATLEEGRSRTYYGDDNLADASWPIYWNNTAKNQTLDDIFIYSPQCMTGRNQAYYTVKAETESSDAQQIEKKGAFGVQWGSEEKADFYGFYPGLDAFAIKVDGTKITANLPGTQNVTIKTGSSVTPNTNGYTYIGEPDMNNMMMVATGNGSQSDASINLQFSPLSTMLDITIKGPSENNTVVQPGTTEYTKWARITSVSIEANAQITGEFTYDYSNRTVTANATDAGSKSVYINTMYMDGDNYEGVMLINDQTLNVKAFLIPNPNVTQIKVKVTTSQQQTFTKTLNVQNFRARQINPTRLPQLVFSEATLDYSIWLSQFDPRIYISELSLPGSALSFNSPMNGMTDDEDYGIYKCQTLAIEDQFKQGVRVFQGHINGNINLCTANGTECKKDGGSEPFKLTDAIDYLVAEMKGTHADEFCVLLLSDYTSGSLSDLYKNLDAVLSSANYVDDVVTRFDANTTIGDIKGKVLVKFGINEKALSSASILNGRNMLFNLWTGKSSTQLNYSNFVFKNIGSNETAINSLLSNATSWTTTVSNWPMIYIHAEEANPVSYKTSVSWWKYVSDQIEAYNTHYDSSTHKVFGLTYLGGNGCWDSSKKNKTTTQVADHYYDIWDTAISKYTGTNAQKPYGWVLFNLVGTNVNTSEGIKKVIEHNTAFTMERDRTKTIEPTQTKSAPSGDVQGLKNDKLF